MSNNDATVIAKRIAAFGNMDELSKRLRVIGNAVDDIRIARPPLQDWMVGEIIGEVEICLALLRGVQSLRNSIVKQD